MFPVFSALSCTDAVAEEDYSNSAALAFNLINLCVEKTLAAHAELNTRDYMLDMTNTSTLCQQGIDSFIKLKHPLLVATHEDSILVLQNKDWKRSQVLQNIIIKFIEVDYHDDQHVSVRLSKMRARNQTIKITLDLVKNNDEYKITKSEIRR